MNTFKNVVITLSKAQGLKRLVLIVVSAFVTALPFMTKNLLPGLSGLIGTFFGMFAWFGLSVLFLTVFDFEKTLKRVISSLFCFFIAFYVFVYSWFVNLYPLDFVGLGNSESIGVIIIAMTCIPLLHSAIMTFSVFLGYTAARYVQNTYLRAALVSLGYVAGEYLQSLGVFAFPWARLFVTQTDCPVLLQSASLFGSYFITFVIVYVNSMLAFSALSVKKNDGKGAKYVFVAVAVFLVNGAFGCARMAFTDYSDYDHIEALVLQGNIPSSEKWSDSMDSTREVYLNLAKSEALSFDIEGGVDVAVMPETAFPVTIHPDDGILSQTEKSLHEMSKILDAELFAGAFSENDDKSYNSVFVFSPDGSVSEPYNKQNIVPFGEFLPYRDVIEKFSPSLASMNVFSSDIARGMNFLPLDTRVGKAACLVCFDSIFPETARKQVANGADFIVISTNDSWYKTSSALYQHADHAVMRAIENNVPVIRSANTGISCIIDPLGNVISSTNVNERIAIRESVPLTRSRSLYNVTGELVVPTAFVVIFLFLVYGFIKTKRASHNK